MFESCRCGGFDIDILNTSKSLVLQRVMLWCTAVYPARTVSGSLDLGRQ